jgi:hypothetical protein
MLLLPPMLLPAAAAHAAHAAAAYDAVHAAYAAVSSGLSGPSALFLRAHICTLPANSQTTATQVSTRTEH